MTLILLSYSNGYCRDSSSTGEIDSITISIDDVRILNSKLLDYEYLKDELYLYEELHANNTEVIINLENKYNKEYKKRRFWYRTSCSLGIVCIIILIL